MKILPVLDLKGGVVVRGVAGRREEYRPIESRWCTDPTPGSVARGLRAAFGFDECYIADLDAITMGRSTDAAYAAIQSAGLQIWLDAGTTSLDASVVRRIIGLESLPDAAAAAAIVWNATQVFSLDLKHGRPLTRAATWSEQAPEAIAAEFVERGVTSMIVLDLAGVGVGQGVPTLDLCRRLRAQYPKLELISGGGVRGLDDLKALRDAGCNAALVASALHDGRIMPSDLQAGL